MQTSHCNFVHTIHGNFGTSCFCASVSSFCLTVCKRSFWPSRRSLIWTTEEHIKNRFRIASYVLTCGSKESFKSSNRPGISETRDSTKAFISESCRSLKLSSCGWGEKRGRGQCCHLRHNRTFMQLISDSVWPTTCIVWMNIDQKRVGWFALGFQGVHLLSTLTYLHHDILSQLEQGSILFFSLCK